MKLWTSEHTFEHPWETVATAAWRKYPNPMNPSVTGIDVLKRGLDKDGRLQTHRLLTTKWSMPDWVSGIMGIESNCYGSEKSIVDPKAKSFTLETVNLTYGSYITIDEKLVYSPHPENPNHTHLKQEAVVSVKGVPLKSYLEELVTNTISGNATKGRQAMEWVIGNIKEEVAAARQKLEDSPLVTAEVAVDFTA